MYSTKKAYSKIIFCFLIVAALFVMPVSSAFAKEKDTHSLELEFDATFEQMLNDPANIDITLRYVELAVELKNYETAIPALERILIFNPDLADVKLELGILYYRLKSYDSAREYLKNAKRGKNVSKEVTKKANRFLKKMGY